MILKIQFAPQALYFKYLFFYLARMHDYKPLVFSP